MDRQHTRERWIVPDELIDDPNQPVSQSELPPPLPENILRRDDKILRRDAPPVEDSTVEDASKSIQLQLASSEHHSEAKRESAGWLSSVVFHIAIFLFIAFLVAPQGRGGTGLRTLHLSFSKHDGDLDGPAAIMEVDVPDEEPEPDPAEPKAEEPAPAESPDQTAVTSSGTGNDASDDASRSARNSDAARGSFFGIESPGQEFVYILDMSGSMKGLRFRRAAAELIRSVNELDPSQKFYVFLFNKYTRMMFGYRTITPRLVQATHENKQRLSNWINSTSPEGGTDPRKALHLATRMNPSAIFILSDGEFTDDDQVFDAGLGDVGDTFSMMEALDSNVLVHSIAFEDPQSRENMERLAEMTGGGYRFVAKVRPKADELVNAARIALSLKDSKARNKHFKEIATEFHRANFSGREQTQFARLLLEIAIKQVSPATLNETGLLFCKALQCDSAGTLPEPKINEFLNRYSTAVNGIPGATPAYRWFELIRSVPRSAARARTANLVGPQIIFIAERMSQRGQHFQAYDIYDMLQREAANTDAGTLARERCLAFQDSLTKNALAAYQNGDLEFAVRLLRDSLVASRRSRARTFILERLRNFTANVLVDAENAKAFNDKRRYDEILLELERGFEGDALLRQFKGSHSRRMREMRAMMRKANEALDDSDFYGYRSTCSRLTTDYPNTWAAKMAQQQLKKIANIDLRDRRNKRRFQSMTSSLYFPD